MYINFLCTLTWLVLLKYLEEDLQRMVFFFRFTRSCRKWSSCWWCCLPLNKGMGSWRPDNTLLWGSVFSLLSVYLLFLFNFLSFSLGLSSTDLIPQKDWVPYYSYLSSDKSLMFDLGYICIMLHMMVYFFTESKIPVFLSPLTIPRTVPEWKSGTTSSPVGSLIGLYSEWKQVCGRGYKQAKYWLLLIISIFNA